jgi:hypothetical protein
MNFLRILYSRNPQYPNYGIFEPSWNPRLLETRIHGLNNLYEILIPMSQQARPNDTTNPEQVQRNYLVAATQPTASQPVKLVLQIEDSIRISNLETSQHELSVKIDQVLQMITALATIVKK